MLVDLNYLLERKPTFYELTRAEQIKYIAFVYTKNKEENYFTSSEVKQVFVDFNLVVPRNFGREIARLRSGKVPVIIGKAGGGFAFHPKHEEVLTLELFANQVANSVIPGEERSNRRNNTEIFNKYDLHADIKRVAFSQFQDGYYKEAVQNALVEVIVKVKEKTKHPKLERNGKSIELDGDDLMNRAMSCDNGQAPMLAFNQLASSLDRAEQRGIMYLFKGVVGIRDKKAHLNFIQNDPAKTIEYLSLASLLLNLLDSAVLVEIAGKKSK